MKKIIVIVMTVVMVLMVNAVANATTTYGEAYDVLQNYCLNNNGEKYWKNDVDETFGIYYFSGVLDIHGFNNEFGTDFPTDNMTGFGDYYKEALEKEYGTEFGVAMVEESLDLNIYHITIAADIDLVDWVDGNQGIVDMFVKFYE